MTTYIIDGLIIATLAFFLWRGYKRGLILTLVGLAAIFLAFFGARFAADYLASPIANLIQPSIQRAIEEVLPEQPSLSSAVRSSAGPGSAVALDPEMIYTATAEPAPEGTWSGFSLRDILAAMGESELFAGLQGLLAEAIEADKVQIVTTAVAAVARYLADLIATAVVFVIVFVSILLACFLLGHTLDLAFRLPVLSQFNHLGGALCGLVKGCVLAMLAVWLLRLGGVLAAENAGPIASVMTIQGLSDLLQSLVV